MVDKFKYTVYTLPDDKEVAFLKGTPIEEVDAYLSENHAESMAFKKPGPQNNPGFISRVQSSARQEFQRSTDAPEFAAKGTAAIMKAKATGSDAPIEELGKQYAERDQRLEGINKDPSSVAQVKAEWNRPGWEGVKAGVGEGLDFLAESIGQMGGGMAIPIGMFLSGGALAGPTGGTSAAVGTVSGRTFMMAQNIDNNIKRAIKNGTATAEEINLAKIYGAGAAQMGLDVVGMKAAKLPVGGAAAQSRKALQKAIDAGSPAVMNAIRVTKRQATVEAMKAGGKAHATEVATEVGQQALERFAAGEKMLSGDEEAMDEYVETFWRTMAGASPFSGYAAHQGYTAQNADIDASDKAIARHVGKARRRAEGETAERVRLEEIAIAEGRALTDVRAEMMEESTNDLEHQRKLDTKRAEARINRIKGVTRTIEDIEQVAQARNIDIGSTPTARAGFQRLVFQTIGKHNLRQANKSQMEDVYEKLSGMDNLEGIQTLPASTTGEAYTIGTKIEADDKGPMTEVQIKREIADGIAEEQSMHTKKDHMTTRVNSIFKRMIDRGIVITETKGKKADKTYRVALEEMRILANPEAANVATSGLRMASESVKIKQDSRGNDIEIVGEYPSHAELSLEVGEHTLDGYKAVREALVGRGVLEKRGAKYFRADVPDLLANRREFSRSEKDVSKWIVRDEKGQTVYIANTKADAAKMKREAGPNEGKLAPPKREKGIVIHEAEFSNIEDGDSNLIRRVPVAFVPEGEGNIALADETIEIRRRNHEQSRKEYLGSKGDKVKTERNPELARAARDRSEGSQDRALELALADPHESNRVLNRYRLKMKKNDPARDNVTNIDIDRQYALPLNVVSESGEAIPVRVKNGMWDEETGRGFGKARMDAQHAGWEGRLADLMDGIKGYTEQGKLTGKGLDALFGDDGRYGMFAQNAGRTLIVDGEGTDAQYFVFDFVMENGKPGFHLYNQFDGTMDFEENVEDMSRWRGIANKRGNPTPETVRVVEQPAKGRQLSPAERASVMNGAKSSAIEKNAAGMVTRPSNDGPRPSWYGRGFTSVYNGIDNVTKKFRDDPDLGSWFRTLIVDKSDPMERNEQNLTDAFGEEIAPEASAPALARLVQRSSDLSIQAAHKGILRWRSVQAIDGSKTDEGSVEVVDMDLDNETREMTYVDPANPDVLTKKVFTAPVFGKNGEKDTTSGGITTVLLEAQTKDEADAVFEYMWKRRSAEIRAEAEGKGEEAIDLPYTKEEEMEGLQILGKGERGARIAVMVNALDQRNEGTVQFLIDTHELSEAEGAAWLRNSGYISFYQEMENAGRGELSDRKKRQMEQAGITRTLIGDLRFKDKHKKLKGGAIVEDRADPMEAMYSNLVLAHSRGLINMTRRRAMRNEVATKNGAGKPSARRVESKAAARDRNQQPLTLRENGEEQYWVVDDPMMFSVLEGDFGNPMTEYLRNHEVLKWVTSEPSQWLRTTVTKNPSFSVSNLFRDATQLAIINGSSPELMMESLARSHKNVIAAIMGRDPKGTNKLLRVNAVTTGADQTDSHVSTKKVASHVKKRIASGDRKGMFATGWDRLGNVSAASESAPREIAFEHTYKIEQERLQREGRYSPEDIDFIAQNRALHEAQETLNFGTRGKSQSLQLFTSAVPFINAMIQGNDVIMRGLSGNRRVGFDRTVSAEQRSSMMARRIMHIAIVSALYEVLMMDDDEYESQSQYDRDNNWMLPIPGVDGGFFKAPLPHGFAWPMVVLPRLIARDAVNASRGNAEKAQRETYDASTTFITSGFSGGRLTPVSLKVPLQLYSNQDGWTGRDIDKQWQLPLDSQDRYNSKTTLPALWLGKLTGQTDGIGIGISPQQLEASMGALTGGLGALALDIVDGGLKLTLNLAGFDVPMPVLPKLEDLVIADRLYSGPGRNAEAEFYKLNERVRRVNAQLRHTKDDPKAQRKVMKANRALIGIEKQMGKIRQQLGALKKKEDDVRANTGVGKKYGPLQAKQIIAGIQQQKTRIAERSEKLQARVDRAS
jgi:hypothetical protein